MKRIFAVVILLSSLGFAQTIQQKPLYELKNEIKEIPAQKPELNLLSSPQDKGKKNVGLAVIYSLLLPGMGELYAGSYDVGKYFTIAEAALWGAYIGINAYGNWQKDNYKSYAAANGGVDNAGKNSDYYSAIGNYKDINQYNDTKSFNGYYSEMYDIHKDYWKWSSTEDRKAYRNMWVSSEQAYTDLRFVVGAVIVNRIISAIDAVRLVTSYNKRLSQNNSLSFSVSAGNKFSSLDGINLLMRASF
jgi:hypothetical protein